MAGKPKQGTDGEPWPWPVDEAALVSIDMDGEKELVFFLPEDKPDDEEVPAAIVYLAACAAIWKSENHKLIGEMIRYFEAGPEGNVRLH